MHLNRKKFIIFMVTKWIIRYPNFSYIKSFSLSRIAFSKFSVPSNYSGIDKHMDLWVWIIWRKEFFGFFKCLVGFYRITEVMRLIRLYRIVQMNVPTEQYQMNFNMTVCFVVISNWKVKWGVQIVFSKVQCRLEITGFGPRLLPLTTPTLKTQIFRL